MKLGQLIEYNNRNIFIQKLCKKRGRETSSRPLFIFLKMPNMRWKQVVCSLVLILFWVPATWDTLKTNLYKTLGYWSRDKLNFIFSEKGLGLFSPERFVYDFSRKMLLILY